MWGNDGGYVEGGASGAGFMNSPSQMDTPQRKERRTQNIVPVTVKTIHDTQGEHIMIGDTEVSMLVIVGIIRKVDVSSTKTTYVIEDSTGSIEGVQWENSDSEFDQERSGSPLMENTYCKVVGSLRTQMGKKHVMIYNIVPLTDLNRLTTHIFEVLHTSYKILEIQNKKMNGGASNGQPSTQQTNQFNQDTGSNVASSNTQGLEGPSKLVYQIIKLCKSEGGLHKDTIYDNTKGKISRLEVDKILDNLTSEGFIFCALDEEHFQSIEGV